MSSLLPSSPTFFDSHHISAIFAQDLTAKMRIQDHSLINGVPEQKEVRVGVEVEVEGEVEEEEEEQEFSFVCNNPGGSPVSADELFHNGQIRPKFPVFDRDVLFAGEYDRASSLRPPLRKLFVERPHISSSDSESDGAPEGPYCKWSRKRVVEASNEKCKKSNSTGFSKLWRFRDLKFRSNSDGNDAFVFLNPAGASKKKRSSSGAEAKKGKTEKGSSGEGVERKVKGKTASLAHEKHYVMSRAKREGDKRKSYLPYRQHLVGFFTTVNGFSRNVHPF